MVRIALQKKKSSSYEIESLHFLWSFFCQLESTTPELKPINFQKLFHSWHNSVENPLADELRMNLYFNSFFFFYSNFKENDLLGFEQQYPQHFLFFI